MQTQGEDDKLPSYNPRGPTSSDTGPKNNIANFQCEKGTAIDDYLKVLTEAIAFLDQSDVVIVALGFDTLAGDGTSNFELTEDDYEKIGNHIKGAFGSKVGIILEGGYSQDSLASCAKNFANAWTM